MKFYDKIRNKLLIVLPVMLVLACLSIGLTARADFTNYLGFLSYNLNGGGVCKPQIPVMVVSPSSGVFGNQTTNTTRNQLFTVSNTGRGTITGIQARMSSAGAFRVYSSSGTDAPMTYKTAFTPVAATAYSNVVYVDSDQFPAVRVPVSGTGIAAEPGGTVLIGTAEAANYTVAVGRGGDEEPYDCFTASASGTANRGYAKMANTNSSGLLMTIYAKSDGALIATSDIALPPLAASVVEFSFSTGTIVENTEYCLGLMGSNYWITYHQAATAWTTGRTAITWPTPENPLSGGVPNAATREDGNLSAWVIN